MKKKKIIIITLIVIILLIAATLGILYVKTDLFKSNETLFYKYLLKTQIVPSEVAEKYQKIIENIKSSNYSSNGTISCSMSANDNSTNIANIQNLFNVKYNMLENRGLKQSYADFTISSNNQDMITLRYLRDDNIYGLKADNIVNKYLALENTNLKDFFSKLGITDVSKIPNAIPEISLKEIMNLDNETLNHIKTTYVNVITEKLTSNNFTKHTNSDKTVTIELSLTEQETADLVKALLETLKNDDNTLNVIINKANIFEYELNIDTMKTSIQEQIDKITNETYSTDEEFIKIAVTENGKDTLKIDFKVLVDTTEANNGIQNKSQASYSVDLSEKNKITIFSNDGKENNLREDITFGYQENSILANIEIFDLDQEGNIKNNGAKIQYQINNYETNNITQNAIINVLSENGETIQLNIYNEIQLKEDIQIEKITTENAEILNNKTSEELSNLIYAIVLRVQYLYGNQINQIVNSRVNF